MAATTWTINEDGLLGAARQGDHDAFRRLVEPRRPLLHAHCYRMLGSLHDAEDALQDALLRAWRGLPSFDGRSALQSWLYRITTNACLDAIKRRSRRAAVPERTWVDPYPDELLGVPDAGAAPDARYEQREAVELAFVAALQHLPARQRAALVLRDVLGYSARETAELIGTTPASVNSALQRARKAIDAELPQESQQTTLRALGDDRVRALVERFTDAMERGDVDGVLATLAADATFAMPPDPETWQGREAVAGSWLMPSPVAGRLRFLPVGASAQPAVAAYAYEPARDAFLPVAIDVFAVREDGIAAVTVFRDPELFAAFGLPDAL